MRLLVATAALATFALSHPFSSCSSSDRLHVSSLTFSPSDEAIPGSSLIVSLTADPEVEIPQGSKAKVTVKLYGMTLYREEIDFCSLVTCPINANTETLLKIEYPVPDYAPSNVDVELDVLVVSPVDGNVGCVKTDVKTGSKSSPNSVVSKGMLGKTRLGLGGEEARRLFLKYLEEMKVEIEASEISKRISLFLESLFEIERHNSIPNVSWRKGLTPFAHLSADEFKRTRLGFLPELAKPKDSKSSSWWKDLWMINPTDILSTAWAAMGATRVPSSDFVIRDDLPEEVDWVAKGAVTPVKNQGACGSCWSFSTTGALEGAYFLKTGKLVSFSEQMLVDCDKTCYGCNGGLMDLAFEWIEENGGLCAEQDYPYVSGTGMPHACGANACSPIQGSAPTSFVDVPANSEQALMTAVAQQPVSVAIEADQAAFQLYRSGVLTGQCGDSLDHGVLVVGYGTDAATGLKYWKIKNSWGGAWGESGFMRIQREKFFPFGRRTGECGILKSPSYPVE